MNEFQAMLKEALMGEEPFNTEQGSADLKASIRKFESQDKMLRALLWGSVVFQMGLFIWSGWKFCTSDADSSPKSLILYATLFLISIQCIGWSKMFIFSNQKSFSILKELKRVQLLLLEGK